MILNFLVYAGVGRLCIFFLRKFPLSAMLLESVLGKGFFCDLCLGTWVYTILAIFWKINILELVFYFPGLSQLLTGAITSFLMYLFVIGWKSEFTVIEVD